MNRCKDCKHWVSEYDECKRLDAIVPEYSFWIGIVEKKQKNNNFEHVVRTKSDFGCVLWEGKDD